MSANSKLTLLAAMVCATVASCTTSQNVGSASAPHWDTTNAATRAGFSLDVSDDSYIDGGSVAGYDLIVKDYGQELVVSVEVKDAQDLKALYFDLAYDPEQVRPLTAEPTEAMGDRSDLLSLISLKERGTVQYGQVLGNWDYRTGLSGDATVAQIEFRKEPTPALPRSVSEVPSTSGSASVLLFDSSNASAELQWDYANKGDFNQDSLVTLADLTPLGSHLNEGDGTGFARSDVLSVIDGDGNGVITIAELTPLGSNLGNGVTGYNVYGSTDPTHVPTDATDVSDPADLLNTAAGTIVPTDAINLANKTSERLQFTFDLATLTPNMRYWVRPYETTRTNEGWPSNVVGDVPTPGLTLAVPPAVGDGSSGNPYIVEFGQNYNLVLTDPSDGDVTDAAGTTYHTSDAGHVTFAGHNMTIAANAGPDFTVYADYNGVNSNILSFHINTVGGTGIKIMPDNTAVTPWSDAIAASDPVDPNLLGTEDHPYVLHDSSFNPDPGLDGTYDTEFTLIAQDDQGGDLDESALTWGGFPPFVALDINDASKGTFHANQFSVGYVFAQNASLDPSNNLYIEVKLDQN
jgi:hypothetical protein